MVTQANQDLLVMVVQVIPIQQPEPLFKNHGL